MIKLVSLNIGLPAMVSLDGGSKKFRSGIFKKPVAEKIYLDENGFQGDGVGDRRIHGGKDLAVCGYFVDHFPYWQEELKRNMEPGAFGENLSIAGINETEINIGDVFQLGKTEIQVSQPRQPCHKLNKIFQFQGMACRVQTTGYSGCYFRVKKPGWVEPDSSIKRIREDSARVSIEMVNRLLKKGKNNTDLLMKAMQLDTLSEEWREKFQMRYEKEIAK